MNVVVFNSIEWDNSADSKLAAMSWIWLINICKQYSNAYLNRYLFWTQNWVYRWIGRLETEQEHALIRNQVAYEIY